MSIPSLGVNEKYVRSLSKYAHLPNWGSVLERSLVIVAGKGSKLSVELDVLIFHKPVWEAAACPYEKCTRKEI